MLLETQGLQAFQEPMKMKQLIYGSAIKVNEYLIK